MPWRSCPVFQASATDVSNFDSEFTNEKPYLTPVHSQLSAADQREFEGFSWVSKHLPCKSQPA